MSVCIENKRNTYHEYKVECIEWGIRHDYGGLLLYTRVCPYFLFDVRISRGIELLCYGKRFQGILLLYIGAIQANFFLLSDQLGPALSYEYLA